MRRTYFTRDFPQVGHLPHPLSPAWKVPVLSSQVSPFDKSKESCIIGDFAGSEMICVSLTLSRVQIMPDEMTIYYFMLAVAK